MSRSTPPGLPLKAMMDLKKHRFLLDKLLQEALKEDLGQKDITTDLLIPRGHISRGVILLKETATLCGLDIAKRVFRKLDPHLDFQALRKDGDEVWAHTVIVRLRGKTRAILSAERVALNFLGYLSGIATKTRAFVKKVYPYKAVILDTRKTIPTLRWLQRFAVRCGGGHNHRFSLDQMVLIKDNHLTALGSVDLARVIERIRSQSSKPIEVEVTNLPQYQKALEAQPDMILLDNMTMGEVKKALAMARTLKKTKRPLLEASGGIDLANVRQVAKTGVARISVGALTHSLRSIDMSLELWK